MNCRGSHAGYKRKMYSYRTFPCEWEIGSGSPPRAVRSPSRPERVRTFTQDDAHIFMLPEQVKDEIVGVIDLVDQVYKLFGFKYHVSFRPVRKKPWKRRRMEQRNECVTGSIRSKGMDFIITKRRRVLRPKIDFHLEDSIGRDMAVRYHST